jgi:hypothetical protein
VSGALPKRPRMVKHAELQAADEQIAIERARNVRLRDSLKALVRQLEHIGGYSEHGQQAELREARAVIAEGV